MNLATTTTVYLLEQDTDITDMVRSLCSEKAVKLNCFRSKTELLKATYSTKPSCIIAANDHPIGQAFELLSQLAEAKTQIPFIILGDHSDVAAAVAAIKAGAMDYIEKPVVYGRLAEHFRHLASPIFKATKKANVLEGSASVHPATYTLLGNIKPS